MTPLQLKIMRVLLLFLISFLITTTYQKWVGDMTIYGPRYKEIRMEKHTKILNNAPAEGKREVGKRTVARTKTRVFSVYLADSISRLTGKSILGTYKTMDTVFLFLIFIAVFMYLRKWFSYEYCLIGILYMGSFLVLTYLFHAFHPWDRISLLSWIALLYLIRNNRVVLIAVTLAVSITIKYDVLLVPVLYWMSMVSRDNWKKTTLITAGLFAVSFGVYELLTTLYPTSEAMTNPESTISNIMLHLKTTHLDILSRGLKTYPPLLIFLLPIALSLFRLRSRERFVLSSVLFGFMVLVILYLMSNFYEVRAEMPVLILLMPAALMSLRDILESPRSSC